MAGPRPASYPGRATPGGDPRGVSTVRVVRPPVWQRIVCAGPLAGPAAVLAVGGGQEDGWLRLLSLAGVPVLPLIAHRGWQLRVELGDGVSIVHWLGTVHVPWADVERFGYDDTSGVWVRRRDGREHAVAASPSFPVSSPARPDEGAQPPSCWRACARGAGRRAEAATGEPVPQAAAMRSRIAVASCSGACSGTQWVTPASSTNR